MIYLKEPLANDPLGDFISFPSEENPDWGYARNKRCVLMTPSAEWVQSAFSCQFQLNRKTFLVPNRDYPYEGLLVYLDGENWKFIDCIALALQRQDGGYLDFAIDSSTRVKANPWKVTYYYDLIPYFKSNSNNRIPFIASYYLNSENLPELITGCFELYFPNGLFLDGVGIEPVIQPFIDIRHMYGFYNFCDYIRNKDSYLDKYTRIHLIIHKRCLTFYLPSVELRLFDNPETINWHYKLGTGNRIDEPLYHKTVFNGENKEVAAFFNLRIHSSYQPNFVRLFFSCSLDAAPENFFLPDIENLFEKSIKKDHDQFCQIKKHFPLSEDLKFKEGVLARIMGLLKFKTYIHLPEADHFIQVPHAGAWWFKTPWYRDVFEGILNNFKTLMKFPEEKENIKKIIQLALSEQDKIHGRILNRIPEFKFQGRSYNSSDATLLCLITTNTYIRETRDLDFASKILPLIMNTISCFIKDNVQAYKPFWIDGPPRVDNKTGLLLTVPHHSWIDTKNQSLSYAGWGFKDLPNRVSERFIKDLFNIVLENNKLQALLCSPDFFMPEINAQWITLLKGTIETIDLLINQRSNIKIDLKPVIEFKKTIQDILYTAEKNFKPIFWNEDNGFLFNIIYENMGVRDEIECETGVVAAAMLGETVFSLKELSSIWECTQKRLLVNRRPVKYGDEVLPFGIITKNNDQRIYYNDLQYHSDVIWLRSTPYIIKLLRLLNMDKTIEEILLNTLDHQMTEAAIFYNQELFSRPFGNNPSPEEKTCQNPVPVKNPIQFWSQWCDAFIDYFGKGGM